MLGCSKTKHGVDDDLVDFISFVKAHYVSRSILFKHENLKLKLKKFYNFNEKNPVNYCTFESIHADLSSRETAYWKYIDDFIKIIIGLMREKSTKKITYQSNYF
jgi:hypothetical protein